MEEYLRLKQEEAITSQICVRILERSVMTNENVDRLILERPNNTTMEVRGKMWRKGGIRRRMRIRKMNAERDMGRIAARLERDMDELMELQKNLHNDENQSLFLSGLRGKIKTFLPNINP